MKLRSPIFFLLFTISLSAFSGDKTESCTWCIQNNSAVRTELLSLAKKEPSGDLKSVTGISALTGKTLCKDELEIAKGCTTIILASDAPKVTLLHELLHVHQIEKENGWCEISKKLWKQKPDAAAEKEIRNREWDVYKFLWENRNELQLNIEDKVSIADGLIQEAHTRKSFDKNAPRYLVEQKVPAALTGYIADYMKVLKSE